MATRRGDVFVMGMMSEYWHHAGWGGIFFVSDVQVHDVG
jgi:hypothetical protein